MKKDECISSVQKSLIDLLGERSGFWSKSDEFAHYARIIKEENFLNKESKNILQKALRGWNGDKWDMVEMLVNLFFDKKIRVLDTKIFATLVLYLFYGDKFTVFDNI